MNITQWNRKHRDVSTRWWYEHLTVEPKTQGCVYTLVAWTSHSGTENTGMCLHVGGMNTSPWNRKHRDVLVVWTGISQWDRKHRDVSTRRWYEHLTTEVEQKTQGCVSTVVVWTPHRGTENTGMCLHVGGMDISQWNRKHRDVSTRWWYEHLTVEPKTQGCVGGVDRHLTVGPKTQGCVYTSVV